MSKSKTKHNSNKPGWFHDTEGRFVLAQKPNAPIILAGLAFVARSVIDGQGLLQTVLFGINMGALGYWAYLELTSGATYIRRLLGAAVLMFVLWSFSRPS